MSAKILFLHCMVTLLLGAEGQDSLVVNTSNGPVRGYKDLDTDVFVFYGIPYATAPTGAHKFQAPLPPPQWSTTMEAVDEGIICPQKSGMFTRDKIMKEDCLIANIYVPDVEEKNLPVVVYVHGGAFIGGYGDMMTPKHLVATGKVIAVNFNYRLGAHGFLCLGTETAPGNAGLKDQAALLQWVNINIEMFGGNPDDVTITGFSAGATSVDLLMLSPVTDGILHKVIADSDSSRSPVIVMNPVDNAKTFAKSLNFTNVDDMYALEEFYTAASFETLTDSVIEDTTDSTIIFAPCIEAPLDGQEFMLEAPEIIFNNSNFRKVPIMYGFSKFEGLLRLGAFEDFKVRMNEKFSDFLPANLKFKNENEKESVANKVKAFYFGNESVSEDNIVKYLEFLGDALFIYPILQAVRQNVQAGNENVYFYEFSFVDKDTPVIPFTDGIKGASHCAQTQCVLDGGEHNLPESDVSEDMKQMKVIMREFWINFIKTGTPVPSYYSQPSWPAANSMRSPHMSLNLPPTLQTVINPERVKFWDEIYEKYESFPLPPPAQPIFKHSKLAY